MWVTNRDVFQHQHHFFHKYKQKINSYIIFNWKLSVMVNNIT